MKDIWCIYYSFVLLVERSRIGNFCNNSQNKFFKFRFFNTGEKYHTINSRSILPRVIEIQIREGGGDGRDLDRANGNASVQNLTGIHDSDRNPANDSRKKPTKCQPTAVVGSGRETRYRSKVLETPLAGHCPELSSKSRDSTRRGAYIASLVCFLFFHQSVGSCLSKSMIFVRKCRERPDEKQLTQSGEIWRKRTMKI